MDKAVALKEQKPGSISDFIWMCPANFSGTEKPLDAEQWLIDMTNLLKAARIPKADQDQLKDVPVVNG